MACVLRHKPDSRSRSGALRLWLVAALAAWLPLAAPAAITVRDDLGHSVRLATPADRIVALAPHITELLFAAGAGDKVVGVSSHSDWPRAARKLPRVGGAHGISLETILMLHPDLVVAWDSGNGSKAIARLRRLGLPVYVSEPQRLADIARTLEQLGRLAGTYAQARRAATDFRTGLQALARHRDDQAVSVFYEIWPEPLITINGSHFISQVIRLCGGRNIFAGQQTLAPQVSIEAVLARRPQVIIVGGANNKRPAWLDAWRNWPELPAVRQNQLYFIAPDLIQRPTPRILQGTRRLCELLDRARHND